MTSPHDALRAERDELLEALKGLVSTASLFQYNSVLCVENHHGVDLSKIDPPGWLADGTRALDLARQAIEKAERGQA